jgi:iron(III) transport system substrate-binding protein
VKNAPKTWMDLTKPEYKGKQIGQVVGPSGGTTWTRSMFERQVLGEDYWAKQAALGIALYPSGAPLSDALVRGEVSIAPLLYNIIYTKIVEGAPAEAVFAPEGVPIIPYADGITKTAKSPNAAKVFMNWRLSKEGQAFQIAKLGNITSLKEPPSFPKGWDPKVIKVWVPKYDEFEKLRESWLEQWNKTYGYRQ